MNKALITTLIAATALTGGCASYGGGAAYDDGGFGYYDRASYQRYGNYDYNQPDPQYNGYYADRYYRDNARYRERQLSYDDRVYRGRDGRYYCRRSDGTTGLIIGGAIGALIGGQLDRGYSNTAGILIGGGAGALLGREIDRGSLSCR